MKIQGLLGKGTGKLGSSVFAVSGGEQIVREYNPNVSNPNTEAQVEQRAKLKLMSQIAAALAPAIAFKKKGLVSARNQFVSANIGLCTFENNEAQVDLKKLDLTGGSSPIPDPECGQPAEGKVSVGLYVSAPADVEAVVYVMAGHDDNAPISLVDVVVVTEAGVNRTFPAILSTPIDSGTVYAYGVKGNAAVGRLTYDDYAVLSEGQEAFLSVMRSLISSASSFTATKGIQLTM